MRSLVVGVATTALLLAGCAAGATPEAPATSRPAATPKPTRTPANRPAAAPITTDGVPALVGPLFPQGVSAPHSCTASVLHSTTGDLLITAAHCLSGTGRGIVFAPGYSGGRSPYGVWTVSAAYASTAWIDEQSPAADVAVLRVSGARPVEQVVGGSGLGRAPAAGQSISAVAYDSGIGDTPISCTTRVYYTGGVPAFDCPNFAGGSSGGPWLVRAGASWTVDGVIGGTHQGGCTASTSYTAPFGDDVATLVQQVEAGAAPETLPAPPGDGC